MDVCDTKGVAVGWLGGVRVEVGRWAGVVGTEGFWCSCGVD